MLTEVKKVTELCTIRMSFSPSFFSCLKISNGYNMCCFVGTKTGSMIETEDQKDHHSKHNFKVEE